ncbi:MAG: chromosomal replication initiator protein DnaA [Bacteroidota bacterium]|nr:chromosomal replication initiator protein DnaA [Bacteroidota bacterium]
MKQDHEAVWQNCLQIIKDNITDENFNIWFKDIVPDKLERNILTIQVKSTFIYEFIEEHYITILKRVLRKELGSNAKLEYKIVVNSSNFTNSSKGKSVNYPSGNATKLDNRKMRMPVSAGKRPSHPYVTPGIKKFQINANLKKELHFENFIEGNCNRLARSAGKAIGSNPGKTAFNPLFIFGESGMGKTHLAQAIGIDVKENFVGEKDDKVVLYIAANEFEKQFTNAAKNNNRNDFFQYYQNIDVLIIDDVHDFSGKVGTQKTFFNIFNHLHQAGKQLILTSDRPPSELNGLNKRLISRFKWGLLTELTTPDIETRISILKQKAYNDGIQLSDKIINYIADNVSGSIRELEGTMVSLLAQSSLVKQEITFEFAKQLIDRYAKKPKKQISIPYIIKTVADYFQLNPDTLKSKSRKREIVQSRQIAMYFSKIYTKSSLSRIGAEFGGKNHATVVYSEKTVKDIAETDKAFKQHLSEIDERIKAGL